MAMKEELKKIKSDIQKEVDWYTATTPHSNQSDIRTDNSALVSYFDAGGIGEASVDINHALKQQQQAKKLGLINNGQSLLADAYHTFMISKNEVQRQTSQGKINTL
nr:MAG TPA: hypothetical protein [Bacteriophage sp.]